MHFFLWNPPIFDDLVYFNASTHKQYMSEAFGFKLRWLPYASFEWTRILFGEKIIWLRLGNLVLHLATTITLFFFLRRLFELFPYRVSDRLSTHWLAFFAALIFALHPISVYAVAYLSQRSMLFATFFSILTWRLFLEGLITRKSILLYASSVTYLLAVFSKENTIMAAAITPILFLLLSPKSSQQQKQVNSVFFLYGLIALLVVFQIYSKNILTQAYEPGASVLIAKLKSKVNIHLLYPLSILNQCLFFFKYLWIWIAPSPAVISIDMCENFSLSLWSFSRLFALFAFVAYAVVATRLLLQKGINGLLGFALLCPWVLFATEFSTIRIQEPFVLYRSYFWMAGAFAALPFLCQKLKEKQAVITLTVIAVFMMFFSWIKLITFSHQFLLWDDAIQVAGNEEACLSLDRMYYNRGAELLIMEYYNEAIADFNKAISLENEGSYAEGSAYYNRGVAYFNSHQYQLAIDDFNKAMIADFNKTISFEDEASYPLGYTYYNRGIAYFSNHEYQLALDDFNKAIKLIPKTDNGYAYHAKAEVLKVLKELASARQSCLQGKAIACKKIEELEFPASKNDIVPETLVP